MNARKEYAAGRIWLQSQAGEGREDGEVAGWRGVIEGGIVYRWACGGCGEGGWRGAVGQDVCLPMSRDSERKRRGELDVRGEQGDKR